MMQPQQILGTIAVTVITTAVLYLGSDIVAKKFGGPPPAPPAVTRIGLKEGAFIAPGVAVPAGAETFYLSGQLANPANPDAPKDSPDYYGDTETQTISIMKKIEALLAEKHMTMGDVAMMHVYLAGDPAKGGKMDFKGMMNGYSKFFGTAEQPNKPSRSTFQVAGLVAPGYLAEIEVLAVAMPN
jgi:enamine deaminase RidA (YjgF/YER057c/UK114 family)